MERRATRRLISLQGVGAVCAVIFLMIDPAHAATPEADAGKAISDLALKMLSFAAVLGAAGTVSMAVLELLKAASDARRRFQEYRLNVWLGDQCNSVLPELLYLAIGDVKHEDALCGQELEKMMGQLQAAARLALDFPEQFTKLYDFLTSTDIPKDATYADLRHAKDVPSNGTSHSEIEAKSHNDRELWQLHTKRVHDQDPSKSATLSISERKDVSDAAQARARLASLVARKLDGFQLRTQFLWDRLNQLTGLILGICVVWYALGGVLQDRWVERLALGVIGGLIAPFAKDFSKALATFSAR